MLQKVREKERMQMSERIVQDSIVQDEHCSRYHIYCLSNQEMFLITESAHTLNCTSQGEESAEPLYIQRLYSSFQNINERYTDSSYLQNGVSCHKPPVVSNNGKASRYYLFDMCPLSKPKLL